MEESLGAQPGAPASPAGSSSSSSSSSSRARRRKLLQYNSPEDAVKLVRRAHNILVLSGAGISTSCGIPDFRSRSGIYAQIEASGAFPSLDEPSDLFDIEVFRDRPEIFYSFAKQIYPGAHDPSPTHRWIRGLEERGRLLRQYTQNIDGLDVKAGMEKVLQCHGGFDTASCIRCGTQYPGKSIEPHILGCTVPPCPHCTATRAIATKKAKKKRKWTEDDDSDDPWETGPPGILKPDICFFGENVFAKCPQFGPSVLADREVVDLVLIIGTSLKVAPVADILQVLPPEVPQVLINMTPILHFEMDIMLLGESDKVVRWLSTELGWGDAPETAESEKLVWRSGMDEWSHLHILAPENSTNPLAMFELEGESDSADDEGDEEGVGKDQEENNALDEREAGKLEDEERKLPLHLEEVVALESKEDGECPKPSTVLDVPLEERYA